MRAIYSTFEAKAKFSQVVKEAINTGGVVISHRGTPVAKIVPYTVDDQSLDERISELCSSGHIAKSTKSPKEFLDQLSPIKVASGALKRFLEDRE